MPISVPVMFPDLAKCNRRMMVFDDRQCYRREYLPAVLRSDDALPAKGISDVTVY